MARVGNRNVRSVRRTRERRVFRIIVTVMFTVVWIPIAIVMLAARVSDRRG